MGASTHACPSLPTITSSLPPSQLSYEISALRPAIADTKIFAGHSRRSRVATAAAVEQPRDCQRRDRESLPAPIGEIGPQQRESRRTEHERDQAPAD